MSKITAKTKMCIIIGDPIEHSMSPVIHNAGYAALGIDDQFVFTAADVKVEHVKEVVEAMHIMNIRGLTCTMPHKIEVMKYLDKIDPVAQKIGAVNTVVNEGGVLTGYNTDWLGTVTPIEQIVPLKNKRVALIGAGGAARAMAYGVVTRGAKLTIFNRTQEKAKELAQEIGSDIETRPMESIGNEIGHFDIILNATNIGMDELSDETPLPKKYIQKHHIVFDAVYSPYETRLLREAKEQGATVIHGTEMLLHQGVSQFELYTGRKAPIDVMRNVLMEKLKISL
ncbi:shikimate dehydrogenase [soil metagenome]